MCGFLLLIFHFSAHKRFKCTCLYLTCMGIDPGVLDWTLGSGASACHAQPIPLFAKKLARALA